MKKIKLILTTAVFATLFSCVNSDDYGIPADNCNDLAANVTVQSVTSTATSTATEYTTDDIIEAYVTSSDQGGNFYKSISFVSIDGAIGFSIPVNLYNLYTEYEPGRKVFIKMQDRFYNTQYNSTVIGSDFNGGVGRLSGVEYENVITRSCTKVNEDDIVNHLTLDVAEDDQYINKLIEFDNVQFADVSVGSTYYDENNEIGGATNHLITDVAGNTVTIRTSSYANFATQQIPNGSGKIRCVLTKYISSSGAVYYQYLLRTINDVKLDNPRISAFYTEDFQTATNNTDLNNPGWTNFAENGTRVWREKTFSGNGYAEFSAFGSGAALNTAWLVSPAINLDNTSNELLTFKVAQHHLDVNSPGNSLTVYFSTDFDGTNVLAATWTAVPANIPTMSTSWYQFLGSSVDISGYNGNIYVAFKFIGSGTNTTLDGAFQVDDIKVYGN